METLRNKVRTKKNSYWTLVVIPASQEKVNNFKLPCWLLRGVLAFAAIGILSVLYFYSSYMLMQEEIASMAELKVVNQLQEEEIARLKVHATEMEQKIQTVQKLDRQVRDLVGLKAESSPNQAGSLSSRSAQGSGIAEREARINLLGIKETDVARNEEMPAAASQPESVGLKNLKHIDNVLSELDTQADYQINNLAKLQQEVTARLQYLEARPSDWPLSGRLSSRFGIRRSPFGNFREFHDGIDIASHRGAIITAAGAGRVVFRGWKAGYGLTVIIEHGHGYTTLYGHNSSVLVKAGQTVKKGAPIARVGSTGRSTGPHLHFTVFRNGKPVDPLKILQ
jgi:murein DD-endopeptidase MepM/ murein hydrolase activator NlpD